MKYDAASRFERAINALEELLIALILGLMTLVTFANVLARYFFGTNILWALETTVFLFAWLVLLGASYCVKVRAHLGVDVMLNWATPGVRRLLALLSVFACLAFSTLLLVGAWNYWAPFAALPMLDGTVRDQTWYEVNDIPMPGFLRFLEDAMNQGAAYEKVPRFIPYAALPLGLSLLTFRFCQVAYRILRGQAYSVIAGHGSENAAERTATLADRDS